MIQTNRQDTSDFLENQIHNLQEAIGIGEWEFIAFICILTLVFWIVRATSNVTLSTLESGTLRYLMDIKVYLKREAKLACANIQKKAQND